MSFLDSDSDDGGAFLMPYQTTIPSLAGAGGTNKGFASGHGLDMANPFGGDGESDDSELDNPFADGDDKGDDGDDDEYGNPFADAVPQVSVAARAREQAQAQRGAAGRGRVASPKGDEEAANPFAAADAADSAANDDQVDSNPFANPFESPGVAAAKSRARSGTPGGDDGEYSYYTDDDEDEAVAASPARPAGRSETSVEAAASSAKAAAAVVGNGDGDGLDALPAELVPEGYEGRLITVQPLAGTFDSEDSSGSESAATAAKKLGRKLGSSLGLFKHTVYTVRTEQHSRVMEVERRYKHFDWLYQQLSEAFSFRLVPTLPERKFFGRFAKNFIARRRAGLESFLNFIANHPIMCRSWALEAFLTTMDKREWEAIMAGKVPGGGDLGNTLGLPSGGVTEYLTPALRIRAEAMAAKVAGYQAFIRAAQKTSERREARIREDVEDMHIFAEALHGALDDSHQPVAHDAPQLVHAGIWVRNLDRELDGYSSAVTDEVWSYQGLLGTAIGIANGMANAVAARDKQAEATKALSNAAATARSKALQAPDDLAAEDVARKLEAQVTAARADADIALYCVLQEWKIFHEYQPQVVSQIMEQYVVGESASLPERVRKLWFDTLP
ncbi:sorting nexin-12 [Thecamonas trahens ATCC 50062]|uniref:Sorting nexin-12 n=1 Tax=Thecamonas trahens ATCC 50062 TaxID=461836 RepID=A0A0L0D2L1_THETB|nr:sorting nexin-12 [Thecamonas trahens ATCC 50062]KNC46547.1 sorting nexin-12 [Thecamonas trahens ATCC 50062]|eukprot:XP_013760326.1 sorting nexin-12 [Thecamonas trahens ATCC 50062]